MSLCDKKPPPPPPPEKDPGVGTTDGVVNGMHEERVTFGFLVLLILFFLFGLAPLLLFGRFPLWLAMTSFFWVPGGILVLVSLAYCVGWLAERWLGKL